MAPDIDAATKLLREGKVQALLKSDSLSLSPSLPPSLPPSLSLSPSLSLLLSFIVSSLHPP